MSSLHWNEDFDPVKDLYKASGLSPAVALDKKEEPKYKKINVMKQSIYDPIESEGSDYETGSEPSDYDRFVSTCNDIREAMNLFSTAENTSEESSSEVPINLYRPPHLRKQKNLLKKRTFKSDAPEFQVESEFKMPDLSFKVVSPDVAAQTLGNISRPHCKNSLDNVPLINKVYSSDDNCSSPQFEVQSGPKENRSDNIINPTPPPLYDLIKSTRKLNIKSKVEFPELKTKNETK